jgi:hypothetical protein
MNGPFNLDVNGVISETPYFINFQQHTLRDWTPLGFKGT